MRRTHLRGHENILKRLLIHVAGFNLSLVMREIMGFGTARGLQGLLALILDAINTLERAARWWTRRSIGRNPFDPTRAPVLLDAA